jgi:hypothetical protein
MIVDWVMPEMDGLELTRALRQTKLGRNIYILILTGLDEDEKLVQAFEAGVDDFMVKPVRIGELNARVAALLRRAYPDNTGGVMEFGRWMFTLNAATEATRWGARLAAVCDKDDIHIKQKMRVILGAVVDGQISIQYAPDGCDVTNCRTVEVSLINATFSPRPAELERAKKIVDAFEEAERNGLGAVLFEGSMIDLPVALRARRTLARAKS